ncbi:MAG: hypothetical protein EXQ81_05405 [Thermoleophilia bacterium]|nr:hypothetical protein [Thermoleophilia bacterium]
MSNLVVEHREGSFSRGLRRRRFIVAGGVATVEAVLVLADLVPWWAVVVAAVAAMAFYVGVGRAHSVPIIRSVSWVAAASQLVVVLVPVAVVLLGFLAFVGVVVLAVLALIVLLLDRR